MNVQSLSQRRAQAAFEIASQNAATRTKTFIALARQLPLMIRTNGLLATWAHLCSKREKAHSDMLQIISRHLENCALLDTTNAVDNLEPEERMRRIYRRWLGQDEDDNFTTSPVGLRELTDESLAFAGWLKRAVDASAAEGES